MARGKYSVRTTDRLHILITTKLHVIVVFITTLLLL